MNSDSRTDPRIDAYIAKSQPFAQPILEHVRQRVHAVLPNAEETTKWGMPAYTLNGKIVLMTAAFKAHAALNFWRGQELRGGAADPDGMGQFGKLKSLEDLPADRELDRLIRQAAELSVNAPAPRKPKHVPAEMHPAFAEALDRAPAAKANFDAFTPGARREYLDWIADAKRDETRQKRIANAIEWLADGKKRNWQYQDC